MRRNQSSITAQGIAMSRALESSRPPGERICYDPLARQLVSPWIYLMGKLFVGYGERRAPGVLGYLAARTRYIDDYLQACIEDGITQLVILGAGFDSRAYRFPQLKGHVRVFEVDHPATQTIKCAQLRQILHDLPPHVTYAPLDFNAETLQKLYDYGFDKQDKTLFIWEGVVEYLTAQAVDNTLAFIRQNSAPGSSVIFDYVYAEALTTAHKRGEVTRMQRYSRFTGEPLTFGIPEGQVEEFLRAREFTQIVNATSRDLKQLYFTGPNAHRPVAPIYAIVHATVPATQ